MLTITLRWSLGIALLCYFALILLFLKNKAIELKYTLLWIAAGICMGILLIFPHVLTFFVHVLGIESNMNGLFAFCIAFLMVLVMALTSIVSKQTRKIRRLIQEQALLEERIRKLAASIKPRIEDGWGNKKQGELEETAK